MSTVPKQRTPVRLMRADEGTDLDYLMSEYYYLKSQMEAAKEEFEAVRKKVLNLAMDFRESDEETKVEVHSIHGNPLSVTYVEAWRVDTKRLKDEDPLTYATFAKKSGSWQIREVK